MFNAFNAHTSGVTTQNLVLQNVQQRQPLPHAVAMFPHCAQHGHHANAWPCIAAANVIAAGMPSSEA